MLFVRVVIISIWKFLIGIEFTDFLYENLYLQKEDILIVSLYYKGAESNQTYLHLLF